MSDRLDRLDDLISRRTTPTVDQLYVVLVPGPQGGTEGVARANLHVREEALVTLPLITDDPTLAERLLAEGQTEYPDAYLAVFRRQ